MTPEIIATRRPARDGWNVPISRNGAHLRGTNVPEAGLSSAEEALSRRAGHRGRPRPDGKLVQDVREVAVHGVVAKEEPFRDLLVREAVRNQAPLPTPSVAWVTGSAASDGNQARAESFRRLRAAWGRRQATSGDPRPGRRCEFAWNPAVHGQT